MKTCYDCVYLLVGHVRTIKQLMKAVMKNVGHKLHVHSLTETHSAQNKGYKLVGHLFKIGTSLQYIIGFHTKNA